MAKSESKYYLRFVLANGMFLYYVVVNIFYQRTYRSIRIRFVCFKRMKQTCEQLKYNITHTFDIPVNFFKYCLLIVFI